MYAFHLAARVRNLTAASRLCLPVTGISGHFSNVGRDCRHPKRWVLNTHVALLLDAQQRLMLGRGGNKKWLYFNYVTIFPTTQNVLTLFSKIRQPRYNRLINLVPNPGALGNIHFPTNSVSSPSQYFTRE